jgi:transposase
MIHANGVGPEGRPRRRHLLSEKRRIVELTFEPGASVAQVAQVALANSVNANQVFKWRRAFERGELSEPAWATTALLPVRVSAPCETSVREPVAQEQSTTVGCIHIEFPGRAMIRVESGADPVLLRSILESLRK